jgi:DNA-binding transcriptional LysR family regulator
MSKLPDFEGLAMFGKVAEERSFAAAARSLGVSVATVSRAVGRLEERLGARLFNRTSRQVALTEFGRTLSETAIRIFQAAEDVENAAREMSSKPRGLIKLAVPMSFGLRWVAPLLPDFLSMYPDVSVDLHLSDAVVDVVGEGFDAALRIAVDLNTSLTAKKICPVVPRVVSSPEYLRQHGAPKHPSELNGRDCFGYAHRARSDLWRFTAPDGSEKVVTPTGPLRVTNVDALVPAILAGIGIGELPDFVASEYLASGAMVCLLPDWHLPKGALYFVSPTARTRPAKTEALAKFLVERLSNPSWDTTADSSTSGKPTSTRKLGNY